MKDKLDTLGAWALGLLWILPLAYAMWAAFHPPAYATRFDLFAPLTLDNFVRAWNAAPFPRYFLNTFLLVTMVLAAQLVLSTLAGYAFARFEFRGRDFVFMLVLLQLMIMPDVLLVENYRSMSQLGIRDTVFAIGLPYFASAFGIFLLRQTFKTVPRELEEAARMEGANALQVLMKVYVPLAADLRGLRAGVGQPPLEQLPVAADHHQLGGIAPADRGTAGVLVDRPGHRLVRHHGRHADVRRPAADCVPAVPAPVRAVVHACGNG